MEEVIAKLHEGGYSCVVSSGSEIRTYTKPGVMDLFEMYINDATFMKGASIADKVVGKGAAALMILGGISRVYADVISQSAIALLENTNVELKYNTIVSRIEDKSKNGICPLEKLCARSDSLDELFLIIKEFVERMRK